MTQDDQDREIGRMTRAYSNNEKTIVRLKCRLSMLAEALPAFLEDPRESLNNPMFAVSRGEAAWM